jgi:hypothetical protein
MKVRTSCVLFSVFLTSLVLANPVWDNARNDDPSGAAPFLADGGGPIPPIPPRTGVTLLADGGGPIPPIPPRTGVTLLADGGGPIPPGVLLLTSGSYVV